MDSNLTLLYGQELKIKLHQFAPESPPGLTVTKTTDNTLHSAFSKDFLWTLNILVLLK